MPLYEIIISAFFIPLFYFGWMWAFRILAGVAVAKIAGKAKESVMESLKGDKKDA